MFNKLSYVINKMHNTHNFYHGKPNWEQPPNPSINCIILFTMLCKIRLVVDTSPQVSHLQLKDATTPCFVSYNWQDDSTPYLPTTTGRRLRPPILSTVAEGVLQHPIYHLPLEGGYNPLAGMLHALAPPNLPSMIIWSMTIIQQLICQFNVNRHLFEGLKHCLYTLKHIYSFNNHICSSRLFTEK